MPSPQQTDVVQAHADGKDIVVLAVAGSGKTTTGVLSVREPVSKGKSVCALAFSTRNEEDLAAKMPPEVLCRNFNKLGMRAWARRVRGQCKVDTKKNGKIRDNLGIHYDHWPQFNRAMSMLKAKGCVPPNPLMDAQPITPWTEVFSILDSYDLFPEGHMGEEECIEKLGEGLRRSIAQAWNGDIDLDDQIYMPALYGGSLPSFDVVLVDEVQDVNPIQRKFVWQISGGSYRNSQILCLGDPRQAIYGFRGADYQSVEHFKEAFSLEEMPLTVSFRCPQAIVKEAQALCPEIEAHPDAPLGTVDSLEYFVDFKPGDVILCRNNRPLVKLAFSLIRRKIPAKVLGRSIGEGLSKLAKKMKCQRTAPMLGELREYYRQEKSQLEAKGRWGSVAHLEDQCGCLAELIKALGDVPARELHFEIDRMFSDTLAPVVLSTIHKAKGLEWPRVFFLDRHLIPSKFAESEDEIEQENNIAYVGITRAMKELFYIRSERE